MMEKSRKKNDAIPSTSRNNLSTIDENTNSNDTLNNYNDGNDGEYKPIELLQGKNGITAKDIEKLKSIGIHTVEGLNLTTKRFLITVWHISETKVNKLKEEAEKIVPTAFFTSAKQSLKIEREKIRITTGSKSIDAILNGGIETGSITQIFGSSKTGKTQFLHTLAVSCQLPVTMGGAEGKCLYIDTEGTFLPDRIANIASRYKNLSVDQVLKHVFHAPAFTTDRQDALLTTASGLMAESRYALLIVDSIIANYKKEYTGRGELAPRQNHLGKFLSVLSRIANEFRVAIVISNQLSGNNKMPAGGNILAHKVNTRLELTLSKSNIRICKIDHSSSLPPKEALFRIETQGIKDIEDEEDII